MKSKSKSKSDSNNSSPSKVNSLNNELKEKRMLIDRILDKLNENKLYTVAIAIFLEIKANNYEAASTKIINQKILSDFKTNKKQYLKNERVSEYYDSEVQVQRAIVASLTVTNVLTRIKKGNQTFVKFNFYEAEEYLKKIKNRQINSLIRLEMEQFYKSNYKNMSSNNKNMNKKKESNKENNKDNKDNLSSLDMNDINFKDDISISIDSNFVGGEEKKTNGENNLDNSFDDLDKNLNNNLDNNTEMDINNLNSLINSNNNNNTNNNTNNLGINLNGGLKKRAYFRKKRGLLDNSKFKLNKNNESESEQDDIGMLDNYDLINDNSLGGFQKKFIKHRRRRRSNKMIKKLEIDIQKFRGRPKKKLFGSFPFSLSEKK